MTTLVRTAGGEVEVHAPGLGVVLLWSLLGLTLSIAVARLGLDLSMLS